MIGTITNAIGIILGSLIGSFLNKKIPDKFKKTVFQIIGIVIVILGIQMGLKTENPVIVIFSTLVGSIIGISLELEDNVNKISEKIRKKIGGINENFFDGFITASLVFCIGSMAIIGPIEEGINKNSSILFTKTAVDFFIAITLGSTFGVGAVFSFIPILFLQGGLTILASNIQHLISDSMINQLSATGGLLLMGLGLDISEIKKIKVTNMLPSLGIVIAIVMILGLL